MPARDCIAVCIDAHPKTYILLRAAAKKAEELGVPWIALYIETPEHYRMDREDHERILRFMTLAEKMGAEVPQIEGKSALSGIVSYVYNSFQNKNHHVRHLIMGQTQREGFFAELRPSLAEAVTRRLRKKKTQVEIVPLSSHHYKTSWFDRFEIEEIRLRYILYAVVSVAVAFALAEFLHANIPMIEWKIHRQNISAFFLIACVVSALRFGLIPGLVSAILGFSVINYYYIPPLRSFGFFHSAESVGLSIFLISAVIISLLGAFSRATTWALQGKESRNQALFNVYRLASQANTRQEAFKILHAELTDLLKMEIAFFTPTPLTPDTVSLAYPQDVKLSDTEIQSLNKSWSDVKTTGLGTINRFDTLWRFEPMTTVNNEIGVIAIKVPPMVRLDSSFGRMISTLADQAASILEHIDLAKMMSESQVREEREKMRSMLLSSVSHDLKTPLVSIIGSLSVYQRMRKSNRLTDETADELTDNALEEAQRLDSFISNILDMTRIESGDISFDLEWCDPEDPLKTVQKSLKYRLTRHTLTLKPLNADHSVWMDKLMTGQVLQNLIDNAVKYAPPQTEIIVEYGCEDGHFVYHIRDQGPGIPEGEQEAVFDKYERLKHKDSKIAGTGLGLAIARAVMEKQGGTITLRNHPEGGAEFTISFPLYKTGGKSS